MSDAGKTKDAGWDVGARQTVDVPLAVVWNFVVGEGLPLWLGDIDELPTEKKATYATRDGVKGVIRQFTEKHRLRVTWQPDDWPHDTVLQLTVKEVPIGTTISFNQEQLADREERRMMLGHWKNVLAAINSALPR